MILHQRSVWLLCERFLVGSVGPKRLLRFSERPLVVSTVSSWLLWKNSPNNHR